MSPLSIPTCCNKTNKLQNLFAFSEGSDAQKAKNIKMQSNKKPNSIHSLNLDKLNSVTVGCNQDGLLFNVHTFKVGALETFYTQPGNKAE